MWVTGDGVPRVNKVVYSLLNAGFGFLISCGACYSHIISVSVTNNACKPEKKRVLMVIFCEHID